MQGFVFRLVPPRPTFATDMTAAERTVMEAHVRYWTAQAAAGRALAFGPVLDAAGGYGIGIVLAEGLADAEALRDADPAMQSPHGFDTRISAMPRLVTPTGTYDALMP